MKKLTVFFLIFFCSVGIAQTRKGEEIDIYFRNTYIESMSFNQFEALSQVAENFNKEILAEKNNRVKILLQDDPWKLIQDKQYTTYAKIIWFNEQQETLKEIKIKISLKQHEEEKLTEKQKLIIKVEKYYTTTAQVCFPLSVLLNGILILLIGLL